MLPDPNSAPDSLAPNHLKEPDVELRADRADEEMEVAALLDVGAASEGDRKPAASKEVVKRMMLKNSK